MIKDNYVKFIKGSQKAFDKLPAQDKKDTTLYFITDENGNIKLYLGNILISSSSISSIENGKLNDLLDVVLKNSANKDILIFDGDKWINISFEELKNQLNMKGASAEIAGTSGLVPVPSSGMQQYFLQGSGNWVDINPIIKDEATQIVKAEIGTLINRVVNLETSVGNLNTLIQTNTDKLDDRISQLEEKDYISKIDFETRVGVLSNDLSLLNNLKTKNKNSLVEAINELSDQLSWQTI